jgi:hypothetical protein
MAAFVVNIVLILAVLVLVMAWLIGSARRRRDDRRQHAEERRLIMQAFLLAATTTEAAPETSEPPAPATPTVASPIQHLDAASVAVLLDLLEDRRSPRRRPFAGLITGPRGVWTAGTRAGEHVASRTRGERVRIGAERVEPGLYRAAAREILDIHAHNPREAHLKYRRYADALGDPALAELHLRSAAHATCGASDAVRLVVEQITNASISYCTSTPNAAPTPWA